MNLKHKLFSNMLLRNMLTTFGERSEYSKAPGSFEVYFQYKIGEYKRDYYLYFPREPFPLQYKNEIFNKFREYSGYDLIKYLEFHYTHFHDQPLFLEFLNYEILERLKKNAKDARLLTAQAWVNEKRAELTKGQDATVRKDIEQIVDGIVRKYPAIAPEQSELIVSMIVEKVNSHVARIAFESEKGIMELTESLNRGKIVLNNRNHEESLIQALVLLKTVQAPPRAVKGEQLFNRFTDSDLAALLHLHFDAFKENKINTLQKKVTEQTERIKPNNPKVIRLNEALQEFFY